MNCLEFRRAAGAEPGADGAELMAHRADCRACARHQDELRALDARLRRALELPMSPRAAVARPRVLPQRFAVAAGIVAAVLVGLLLWTSRPAPTLAAEMAAHLAHEPEALSSTRPLPDGEVTAVLAQFGLGLRGRMGAVVYAENCVFRGRERPHFVVRTDTGPVTVFLVPEQEPRARERMEIDGRPALLVPVATGGAVVVGANDADVDAVAARVVAALVRLR